MFCTEEQRKNCRVEKMGCEGCYYNNDLNNIEKVMFPIKEENLLKDGDKVTEQGIIRKETEQDKIMNEEVKEKDKEDKAIKFYKNFIEAQEKELDWLEKEDEEYYKDEIEEKQLLIKGFKTIQKLIEKQQHIIAGQECVIETQAHNEEVYEETLQYRDKIIDLILEDMAFNYDINSIVDITTIKNQLKTKYYKKAKEKK